MSDEASKYTQAIDQPLISCEICLKSIPGKDSKSVEVDDYVAYFCGLDCYDVWVKQAGKADKE